MITSEHSVLRFVRIVTVRMLDRSDTDRINSSSYKQAKRPRSNSSIPRSMRHKPKQARYNRVVASSVKSVTAYSREVEREGI